jgi:hypothetical protein
LTLAGFECVSVQIWNLKWRRMDRMDMGLFYEQDVTKKLLGAGRDYTDADRCFRGFS